MKLVIVLAFIYTNTVTILFAGFPATGISYYFTPPLRRRNREGEGGLSGL